MSVEMVRSMSKSMLGSFKSITGSQMNNSMFKSYSDGKGNNTSHSTTNMRSSKMIEHLKKKSNENESNKGKPLSELFKRIVAKKNMDSSNILNNSYT